MSPSFGHFMKFKSLGHIFLLTHFLHVHMVKRSLHKEMQFLWCKLNVNIEVCQVYFRFNPLYLWTRGRWELTWAFPSVLDRDQVRVKEARCGRRGQQYCSHLMVSRGQAQHTGSYRCRYRHRPRKQSSVYVYVTGNTPQHFFHLLLLLLYLFHLSFSVAILCSVSYSPIAFIVYIPRLNRM